MANKTVHLPIAPLEPLGGTLRKDNWWAGPAPTVLVLSGFIVYATWRAFEGSAYEWGAYLSPVLLAVLRRLLGAQAWGLGFLHAGDAHPAGPRVASASLATTTARPTTARSRGTRRRAPSASARRTGYNGETKLLLFQNLHRYAMYVAVIFLVILWKDAIVGRLRLEGRRARRASARS